MWPSAILHAGRSALLGLADIGTAACLGACFAMLAPPLVIGACIYRARARTLLSCLPTLQTWLSLATFMLKTYGLLFFSASIYTTLGPPGAIVAAPLFQISGCKGLLVALLQPPWQILDVLFLLGILPCVCTPCLMLSGYGGAAFLYLWTAFFWRRCPGAPLVGLVALCVVYLWATSLGLFSSLSSMTSIEFAICACGVPLLSEFRLRVLLPLFCVVSWRNETVGWLFSHARDASMEALSTLRAAMKLAAGLSEGSDSQANADRTIYEVHCMPTNFGGKGQLFPQQQHQPRKALLALAADTSEASSNLAKTEKQNWNAVVYQQIDKLLTGPTVASTTSL